MHDHRIEYFHAKFGVLVCSSTRSMENDESGTAIINLLEKNGHEVSNYEIVRDDEAEIIKMVLEFICFSDSFFEAYQLLENTFQFESPKNLISII